MCKIIRILHVLMVGIIRDSEAPEVNLRQREQPLETGTAHFTEANKQGR